MAKQKKHPTSMRLTPTAERLVEAVAKELGVSKSAVMELAIRAFAKQHNVVEGANDE